MKALALLLILTVNSAFAVDAVNIYTDRSQELMAPLAEEFKARTGAQVNILNISNYSDLAQRLEAEGENSPADLIFVKDMVYLNDLVKNGFLQPMKTEAPVKSVASSMRHPEGFWTAVNVRPRTVVFDKTKVSADDIKTYADLATDKWSGKLCLRTSSKSYNIALVSNFIANYGTEETQSILEGYVRNLARAPYSGDTAVIEAIESGDCVVGIVNSYYLARKYNDDPTYPVGITFVNQDSTGVHVNGTGVGVAWASKNPEGASDFIAMMLEDKWQTYFSSANPDYPAKLDLLPEGLVRDWGVFKADSINWSDLGEYHEEASNLVELVGYE